ncbi:hypothetical protein V500_11530 [Pseudogymnoascus sp. VKM F-4518 (FW-2643)]|nr:hypothetical protein V500_11530 [Pseudogymnoascus sp. VKM F-4518 (FW-2643)]
MVGNLYPANAVEAEARMDVPNRTQQPRGKSRADNSSAKGFKRAYKACVRCRMSKAKCELLQPADNSLPLGPCIRLPSTDQSRTGENVPNSDDDDNQSRGQDFQSSFDHNPQPPHNRQESQGSPRSNWLNASPVIQPHKSAEADGSDSELTSAPNRLRRQSMIQRSVLSNRVMRTVVSSSNDALGLLFEAVEQQQNGSFSDGLQALGTNTDGGYPDGSHSSHHPAQHISPHSSMSTASKPGPILQEQLSSVTPEILRLWNRCRFVKQGWFTAREAVTYIDLFSKNCAPLTPILTDYYFHHSNHHALVTEEPLLCCTILMISSRIHVLPGMGGISRAHFIHGRLWQHLEHLISRVIFGQEKISTAKTRTLGTIESLLLMTEWHPRALHFPPESDGWDFDLLANPDMPEGTDMADAEDSSALYRWREEVFEPAKRSDRMSWMLVGAANSLAHELGIFSDWDSLAGNEGGSTAAYEMRRLRARMLLHVYINQLAARLGCTTLVPENACHTVIDKSLLLEMTIPDQRWYSFMTCWIEITTLMETVTDMFFPSAAFTRISTPFRDLLFLEYHYIRMYVNSLSIQAIVERTVSQSSNPTSAGTASSERSASQPPSDDLLVTSISASDYNLISEVIDASVQILKKSISLSQSGQLIHAPMRTYVRIVSASIFLLKAISLGARNTDIQTSLDVLDEFIQALQISTTDEVHLGSRYGTLLERHVRRFRRNFVGPFKASKTGLHRPLALNVPPYLQMISSSLPDLNPRQNERAANLDAPLSGEQGLGDMEGQARTLDLDGMQFTGDGGLDPAGCLGDDWLAQPFDPNIAPFGVGGSQFMGVTQDVTATLKNVRGRIPSLQASRLRTMMLAAHNDPSKILAHVCSYDGMSSRLVEESGQPMVFLAGYPVASGYGLPDTGYIAMQEMCDKIQDSVRQVSIPVMADGDTGYGSPMNVRRTVESFALAGAAGVMIEDQTWPKRCGHTKGKAVVSRGEAYARIQAACDARDQGLDIFVLARTDALINGWEEAMARVQEFKRIGVDAVFVEALPDREAMKRCVEEAGIPTFANIIEGGKTENLSAKDLAELGFCAVAYPWTLVAANIKSIRETLEACKKSMSIGAPPVILSFDEVCLGVGFNKYWKGEERYKYDENNLLRPVKEVTNGHSK